MTPEGSSALRGELTARGNWSPKESDNRIAAEVLGDNYVITAVRTGVFKNIKYTLEMWEEAFIFESVTNVQSPKKFDILADLSLPHLPYEKISLYLTNEPKGGLNGFDFEGSLTLNEDILHAKLDVDHLQTQWTLSVESPFEQVPSLKTVSYTHLTLPTIYSV